MEVLVFLVTVYVHGVVMFEYPTMTECQKLLPQAREMVTQVRNVRSAFCVQTVGEIIR